MQIHHAILERRNQQPLSCQQEHAQETDDWNAGRSGGQSASAFVHQQVIGFRFDRQNDCLRFSQIETRLQQIDARAIENLSDFSMNVGIVGWNRASSLWTAGGMQTV